MGPDQRKGKGLRKRCRCVPPGTCFVILGGTATVHGCAVDRFSLWASTCRSGIYTDDLSRADLLALANLPSHKAAEKAGLGITVRRRAGYPRLLLSNRFFWVATCLVRLSSMCVVHSGACVDAE